MGSWSKATNATKPPFGQHPGPVGVDVAWGVPKVEIERHVIVGLAVPTGVEPASVCRRDRGEGLDELLALAEASSA